MFPAWGIRGVGSLQRQARRRVRPDDGRRQDHPLNFAECIGACDGAPACLVNDVHVMDVTPEKVRMNSSLAGCGR